MEEYLKPFLEIGGEIYEFLQSVQEKSGMGREIGTGADGSPTKFVDRKAEDIIIRVVAENDLPLNIVSEERGIISRNYQKNLLVDPIDGTFNLVHNIPAYAVSMAVCGSDVSSTESGFIMNLASGDWYYTARGHRLVMNGKECKAPEKRSGTFLVHLSSKLDKRSLELISRARKYRYMGCAALELAMVASGSADVSAHLGRSAPLRNIDVAAGVMMVREAGGTVVDGYGKDFNLGIDPAEKKNLIAAYSSSILEGFL